MSGSAHPSDPVAALVFALAIILLAAKIGGELSLRLGQPAVLGELVAGIALGNARHLGIPSVALVTAEPGIEVLSGLGILVLLFEVGLESTVGEMLAVGPSSLLVAILGVAGPFVLGWGVGHWLLPNEGAYVHAFLGATLAATSVGITARVLQELGRSDTPEARIILGAAVVDDILGLILLTVVTGAVADGSRGISPTEIALAFLKASAFVVLALALGTYFSPRILTWGARLQSRGVLLTVGLCFCFLSSAVAAAIGLSSIVGAFAAGLVLEEAHAHRFIARGERGLEELMRPISDFLVPVFFVAMGMRTDLAAFARPSALALAGALTIAAVLGKQMCALGVVDRGIDRISIGIGMIPRGEVGLIFVSIGRSLARASAEPNGKVRSIIDDASYAAVVVMVILTTMIAPPALKWRLGRRSAMRRPDADGSGKP